MNSPWFAEAWQIRLMAMHLSSKIAMSTRHAALYINCPASEEASLPSLRRRTGFQSLLCHRLRSLSLVTTVGVRSRFRNDLEAVRNVFRVSRAAVLHGESSIFCCFLLWLVSYSPSSPPFKVDKSLDKEISRAHEPAADWPHLHATPLNNLALQPFQRHWLCQEVVTARRQSFHPVLH